VFLEQGFEGVLSWRGVRRSCGQEGGSDVVGDGVCDDSWRSGCVDHVCLAAGVGCELDHGILAVAVAISTGFALARDDSPIIERHWVLREPWRRNHVLERLVTSVFVEREVSKIVI